jgi:hypothetical protein
MLNKIFCSSSLIFIVMISALPSNAKPLKGTYTPFASDVSLEIENNRFREGAGLEGGAGKWQKFSNLKEIKKGVVSYRGQYYCHRSLLPTKSSSYVCNKSGVKIILN